MSSSFHRITLLLSLLLLLAGCTVPARTCDSLPRGHLLVPKPGGGFWRLQVEIADTMKSRARGLMFRRHLQHGHGMLLLWHTPQHVAIWMKNTYLPLDVIFIAKDRRIARVHYRARPFDTTLIPSRQPVIAVLEVPAGDAARFNLRPGVRLQLPKRARVPSCP